MRDSMMYKIIIKGMPIYPKIINKARDEPSNI
jgi:hypothetical protein